MLPNYQNFRRDFLIIFVAAFFLVFSDFLAILWMSLISKFPRPLIQHLLQTLGFLFLLRSVFTRQIFFIWLLVLFFFSFLQWICLSYYGSYLSPMMIFLFFRDFREVIESGKSAGAQLIKPFLMGAIGLIIWNYSYLRNKVLPDSHPWLKGKIQSSVRALILFSILYPIPRTYLTGHTFGKQAKVQELSSVNFYGATSYFLGKILPAKISSSLWAHSSELSQGGSHPPSVSLLVGETHPQRHVIFILGESLGLRHLQLFGYDYETTPELLSLHKQNMLMFRRGVSGGVSTDVSIPMLIQAAHGPEASTQVATQEHCLFKLAKRNGFQTAFISVQTQENLQHIINFFCNTELDYFTVGDNSKTIHGESAILDEELLNEAQKLSWDKPQFVLFHQRGSHSPYEMRYPPSEALRTVEKTDSWVTQNIKHYDNSIKYTDKNIAKLISWIRSQTKLPVEVVFTSDHGELLGEDQQWGHVILHPVAAEVPVLYSPSNAPEAFHFREIFSQQGEWVSHQFVSHFLIHLMGYNLLSEYPEENKNYFVMGADLDGLGGFMHVTPQGHGLVRVKE